MKKLVGIIEETISDSQITSIDEADLCLALNNAFRSANLDRTVWSYKNIAQLSNGIIVDIMQALYASPGRVEQNTEDWEAKIAPANLIKEDFESFDFELYWGNTKELRQDLAIRAIPGHAEGGHCGFRSNGNYSNTMTADVINALIKSTNVGSSTKVRNRYLRQFADNSQLQINDIVNCLDSFDIEQKHFRFKDHKDKHLGGLGFMGNLDAHLIEAWRGFFYTTRMDQYEVRSLVKKQYGLEMGGGESYPVDINKLKEYDIGLSEMASGDYHIPFLTAMDPYKRIELFKKMGIIIDNGFNLDNLDIASATWDVVVDMGIDPNDYPDKDIRDVYVRLYKGRGVADDIAIMLSAFLPSTFSDRSHSESDRNSPMSRMVAGFLGDRIDTIGKDTSIVMPGGQDEIAGEFLNRRFRSLSRDKKFRERYGVQYRRDGQYDLVKQSTIIDFVAAAAIIEQPIHCSQRYFLMTHDSEHMPEPTCALNEYFRYVKSYAHTLGTSISTLHQGKGYDPSMEIGFHKVPLRTVLAETRKRIDMVIEPNKRRNNLSEFYKDN